MRKALLAAFAAAMLTATAPPAFGATTVGQAAPSTASELPCSTLTGVQDASGAGAPSYTIPSQGVLTGYTTRGGTITGGMRLVVFRHGAGSDFVVVDRTDPGVVPSGALTHFPARISVLPGDLLGIQVVTQDTWCVFAGVPGDHHFYDFGLDLQKGATFSTPNDASGNRWNIEATLEPDADHDGFGDETQDRCPANATAQGACKAKKCKKKKHKHSAGSAKKKKCKKKKG
jgi:hypothetical protein